MKDTKNIKDTKVVQAPRVSVSRSRTISLGRFGLDYEKEEIFISLQSDLDDTTIKKLLDESETLLDEEVRKIEAYHQANLKSGKA